MLHTIEEHEKRTRREKAVRLRLSIVVHAEQSEAVIVILNWYLTNKENKEVY